MLRVVKRLLVVSLAAAAGAAAIAAGIVSALGWSADRLATALFVTGALVAALGTFSFTGGTTQSSVFGGGAMGRGHALLAETHALGPDGHLKMQAHDRGGRIGFAWVAMIAGALVIGAGALISVTTG